MNYYHINVFYSAEDEGFIADIPDLKGCSAFGDTPEKALSEVLIAQRLWLEVAQEDNVNTKGCAKCKHMSFTPSLKTV